MEKSGKPHECYRQGCSNQVISDDSFCSEACRSATFGAPNKDKTNADTKIAMLQNHYRQRAAELSRRKLGKNDTFAAQVMDKLL